MVKVEYSQIVRKKLKRLRNDLTQNYGEHTSKKVMGKMMKEVRLLDDIDCDYMYIFIEHNYFFYRIKDSDTIIILEMFHENEDFMRKLFGIVTTSQDTIDYWGE